MRLGRDVSCQYFQRVLILAGAAFLPLAAQAQPPGAERPPLQQNRPAPATRPVPPTPTPTTTPTPRPTPTPTPTSYPVFDGHVAPPAPAQADPAGPAGT